MTQDPVSMWNEQNSRLVYISRSPQCGGSSDIFEISSKIKTGEIIRVDTRSGQHVERAK